MSFDWNSSVEVKTVDTKPVIPTNPSFDWGSAQEVSSLPTPQIPKEPGALSKFAQWFSANTPLGKMQETADMLDHVQTIPDKQPQEDEKQYTDRVNTSIQDFQTKRNSDMASQGVMANLEIPMTGAIALGAVEAPLAVAGGVAAFSALDTFINLRRFTEAHFPNTSSNILDGIEIVDFVMKGGLIGGAFKVGKGMVDGFKSKQNVTQTLTDYKLPTSSNIEATQLKTIFGDTVKAETTSPLHSEALKYKTAEEFARNLEYHGTNADVAQIRRNGFIVGQGQKGISTTQDIQEASNYGKNILPVLIKKDAEMVGTAGKDFLTGTGSFSPNDVIQLPDGMTKPQLLAIWNEAHGANIPNRNIGLLSPEEKADFFKTLNIDQSHVDASIGRNIPLNVSNETVSTLMEKPYFSKIKDTLSANRVPPPVAPPATVQSEGAPEMKPMSDVGIKSEEIYQSIVNRFQSIENLVERAKAWGHEIKPGEDAGLSATRYLSNSAQVKSVIENGTFRIKKDGTIEMTGEGLEPILKDYSRDNIVLDKSQQRQDLVDYLFARRTVEDLQRPKSEFDKENIVTKEQVEEANATLENLKQKYYGDMTVLERTAERLYDFQKRVLHSLVDSGNMSQEMYDNIVAKNPNYIPFDRIMPDEGVVGGTPITKNRFSGAKSPIKKIKGSELEKHDPIESILKNTYKIMDRASRNKVWNDVYALKDIPGIGIEDVSPKFQAINVSGKEMPVIKNEYEMEDLYSTIKALGGIKRYNKDLGAGGLSEEFNVNVPIGLRNKNGRGLDEIADILNREYPYLEVNSEASLLEALSNLGGKDYKPKINYQEDITVFRPSPFKPSGNVVEGYVDGKRKYIEVSKNLYDAMTGLNETSSSLLVKILAKPANWLRTGATTTPEFILRNPIRDQWTALLQTSLGWKPFIDTGSALADVMGKSKVYNDWIRSGGAYAGFVELSRPNLARMVKRLEGKPDLLAKLNPINSLGELSQLMEQATRVGVYKAAIRKGLSPVEASKQSRESTLDFTRRGSSTRDYNAVIPFLNAGIQSVDKMVRTAKKDPVGMTAKAITTITIPSLLLYAINRQDPEYKEIPRWQKDLFWLFKVNGVWVRVPKPFSYGQIFGSLPERFFEYLDTKDARAFDNFAQNIYNSFSPVSGDPMSGLLPTAIKPLLENKTNFNFFRGRAIVTDSKKGLLPYEQSGKYDTKTAKMLGKVFNVSPSKIENLISGYFGGMGRYGEQISDLGINAIKLFKGEKLDEKKPIELSDLPILRGFVSKDITSGQAESLQRFYDSKQKIDAIYLTYKSYIKSGEKEKAIQLQNENPAIRLYERVSNTAKNIAEITKQVDNIYASKTLTDEMKNKKADELELRKISIARQVNEMIKKYQ